MAHYKKLTEFGGWMSQLWMTIHLICTLQSSKVGFSVSKLSKRLDCDRSAEFLDAVGSGRKEESKFDRPSK